MIQLQETKKVKKVTLTTYFNFPLSQQNLEPVLFYTVFHCSSLQLYNI